MLLVCEVCEGAKGGVRAGVLNTRNRGQRNKGQRNNDGRWGEEGEYRVEKKEHNIMVICVLDSEYLRQKENRDNNACDEVCQYR